jgi:hypothetical protein
MMGLRKYVGPKLRARGTNFVPDFLENGIIGDIKGELYVTMRDQLRAIARYAEENGLRAVLYVADKASRQVKEAFEVIKVY